MPIRPSIAIAAGAIATATLALIGAASTALPMAEKLTAAAAEVAQQHGASEVKAEFLLGNGWPTRHPLLSGGEKLDEETRAKLARAIAAIPGVGGIRWADGTGMAQNGKMLVTPMNCQKDVEALLRVRSIRFEESSSAVQAASQGLLDEVAAALRPCLGNIIAITGHTDNSGPEAGNLALSKERANTVRNALIARGIPRDGLRAVGYGSSRPVEGLDPADPANRRIEFSVVATAPIEPTPVDKPGAR